MQTYKVQNKHTSSKKHIAFFSSFDDPKFIAACKFALCKHGFTVDFDGSYLYVRNLNGASRYANISIESDEWGVVWAEASPWGSVEENTRGIKLLEDILIESGKFVAI